MGKRTHLLAAPDDQTDLVFVLQQLSQLSGPQSSKLQRQRHDDTSALCFIKGVVGDLMSPAGAQCELLMLHSGADGKHTTEASKKKIIAAGVSHDY